MKQTTWRKNMMIKKEFAAAREFATAVVQMHEQQHYEAATGLIKRLEGMLGELETSLNEQFLELKAKLNDAEAKIPKVIDGTHLVVNCATEGDAAPAEATAGLVAPAPEAAPAPQAAP
jgi:hypothetical protein